MDLWESLTFSVMPDTPFGATLRNEEHTAKLKTKQFS